MRKQRRMRAHTPNEALRGLREAKGLTQTEMAQQCGLSVREYQLLEGGYILSPRATTLEGIYAATGKSRPEEIGFQNVQLASIRVPSMARPVSAARTVLHGRIPSFLNPFLPTNAGNRVGQLDVDRILTHGALLSGVYDQWGGGYVHGQALVDTMRSATAMLAGRYAMAEHRRTMSAAVANLVLVVGAMLADQGDHAAAQTALLVGLVAARDADRSQGSLRARILAQMARHALDRRDLPSALGLLDLADSVAEVHRLPPDMVALLTALRAGATGPLGQLEDTLTLAARAQDLHASVAKPDVSAVDVAYEAAFGLACLELCVGLDVDNATGLLDRTVDSYLPHQVRPRALAETFRVLTLIQRGDGTTALDASASLRSTVESLRSAQVRESLALAHLLPRVVRLDPEATVVSTTLRQFPARLPMNFLRRRPQPLEVAAALRHA